MGSILNVKSIINGIRMVIEALMRVTTELGLEDEWKLSRGKREPFQLRGVACHTNKNN